MPYPSLTKDKFYIKKKLLLEEYYLTDMCLRLILVFSKFTMSNMSLNLWCVNVEHTDSGSICRGAVNRDPRASSNMHSDRGGSVMHMLLLTRVVVI